MSGENADISVEIACECDDPYSDLQKLEELAVSVCARFETAANVSIAIVDDEAIARINAEFLNKSHQTDVISFDLSDEASEKASFELVINADEARRQAEARNHSTEAELALYITHGLLHNLGFDDGDSEQSRLMHETEDKILTEAGYGRVYEK